MVTLQILMMLHKNHTKQGGWSIQSKIRQFSDHASILHLLQNRSSTAKHAQGPSLKVKNLWFFFQNTKWHMRFKVGLWFPSRTKNWNVDPRQHRWSWVRGRWLPCLWPQTTDLPAFPKLWCLLSLSRLKKITYILRQKHIASCSLSQIRKNLKDIITDLFDLLSLIIP